MGRLVHRPIFCRLMLECVECERRACDFPHNGFANLLEARNSLDSWRQLVPPDPGKDCEKLACQTICRQSIVEDMAHPRGSQFP